MSWQTLAVLEVLMGTDFKLTWAPVAMSYSSQILHSDSGRRDLQNCVRLDFFGAHIVENRNFENDRKSWSHITRVFVPKLSM